MFLTALAIVDDMGAVIVIALFYTAAVDGTALAFAALALGGLVALNMLRVTRLTPYLVLGSRAVVFRAPVGDSLDHRWRGARADHPDPDAHQRGRILRGSAQAAR